MTDEHDERRIEYRPLRDLKADPRNPKAHAQDAIGSSVARFGFVEPIIVDERTGFIASGHGRVSTLTQMRMRGDAPPEGVHVSKKRGWMVPVVLWRSRNDAEAGAALIAFNRTGELGGWADEALLDLLHELEDDALGFDADDLETLERSVAEAGIVAPAPDVDLDMAPPLRATARSKLGDVWVLGNHRVVCGDATDPGAYAALLQGEDADMMWTDPPYGVDYLKGLDTPEKARKAKKRTDGLTIANDGSFDLPVLLAGTFIAALGSLRPGAPFYVAHADTERVTFELALRDAGYVVRQNLVWVKNSLALGRSDYHYRHEPILYGFTPGGQGRLGRGGKRWYGNDKQTSVFEFDKPGRSKEHPTMKPIALIEAHLRNSARAGHVILDPFGGSGSTLIAAQSLGMHARLIELDPIYVDVIVDRWERVTGGKARRA